MTQALERAKLEYNDVAIYETCYRNPKSQALREAVEELRKRKNQEKPLE